MIRIWLENGKPALFNEYERVWVASDILSGEYLVNDRELQARDLLTPRQQAKGIGYVLLDLDFCGLDGMDELEPDGLTSRPNSRNCDDTINVYRVVKIDRFDP